MRKLLIALILCPAFAWAADFPGCTYQKTVTYTTAKILEDGTYAAYVDLSELGVTWWSNCSLSTNIIVTNTANDTSSYLKYVDAFDKSARTGILWFKLAATTASGGYAKIQTGKTVNVANNKKVFTDCNIYLRYAMEEASGTLTDAAGNYNSTVNANLTYGATGSINSGITTGATSQLNAGNVTQLNEATSFTLSMWTNPTITSTAYFFDKSGTGRVLFYWRDDGYTILSMGLGTKYVLTSSILSAGLNHISIVYNGALSQANIVKLYSAGTNVALSPSVDFPTNTGVTSGNLGIFNSGTNATQTVGTHDEVRLYSDAKSANYIKTDYNLQNHKAVAVYAITDSGSVGTTIYDQPPAQFVESGFYYASCDSLGTYVASTGRRGGLSNVYRNGAYKNGAYRNDAYKNGAYH